MIGNDLLWCLFGISSCFFTITVCREAIVDGRSISSDYFASALRYQVSVQIHGHGHVCGGGIIRDEFILTAAHCVLNQSRQLRSSHISVLIGTANLNRINPPAVIRRVEEVFFPLEFHPSMEFKHGDIAVLKLIVSSTLPHEYLMYYGYQKLQLPHNDNIYGYSIKFAGFGWQSYNKSTGYGHADGYLQYIIDPNVLSDLECERHYPLEAIDLDKQICIGSPRMIWQRHLGPCVGDDGGPLVERQRGNKKTVVAILSRIPLNCDFRNEPAVFTRVIHYERMIFNVMEYGHDSQMLSLSFLPN